MSVCLVNGLAGCHLVWRTFLAINILLLIFIEESRPIMLQETELHNNFVYSRRLHSGIYKKKRKMFIFERLIEYQRENPILMTVVNIRKEVDAIMSMVSSGVL